MPETFMQEVLTRLDNMFAAQERAVEKAEAAARDSAKARTGNKLLTAALILVVAALFVSGWAVLRANDAADTAQDTADSATELVVALQAVVEQQNNDREAIRLSGCQSRNSAQEAGRQGVALAFDKFITEVARELPNSVDIIERIRTNVLSGLPTFEGIDTDCNNDGFYTSADYLTVVPLFPEGAPVSAPPTAATVDTVPTTTQPGD